MISTRSTKKVLLKKTHVNNFLTEAHLDVLYSIDDEKVN
jgi:hypothetical protein